MALNYVSSTITLNDLGQPRSPGAAAEGSPTAPTPLDGAAQRPNDLLEHLLAQTEPTAQAVDLSLDRSVPLIGRGELFADIRQQLLAGPVHLALEGLPGVGKTRLALELAKDEQLRRHFG